MDCKKLLAAVSILLVGIVTLPRETLAQWSVGASYEIRQEDPTSGFGFRVERQILKPVPIVDLGLRAHFSYFNEENGVTSEGIEYGKIQNYDFGIAAIGAASVGLARPYIGLGIGSNTFDIESDEVQNSGSESKFFWNGLVGAEITPVPIVTPFVEYRFQQVDEPEFVPSSSGRLIFGLSFSF